MPQEEIHYVSDKVSQLANIDFLTSLDITREVHLPKANESISNEMNHVTYEENSVLNGDTHASSVNSRVNTIFTNKHSSITFASVFKSASLSKSFDDNNNLSLNNNHDKR